MKPSMFFFSFCFSAGKKLKSIWKSFNIIVELLSSFDNLAQLYFVTVIIKFRPQSIRVISRAWQQYNLVRAGIIFFFPRWAKLPFLAYFRVENKNKHIYIYISICEPHIYIPKARYGKSRTYWQKFYLLPECQISNNQSQIVVY